MKKPSEIMHAAMQNAGEILEALRLAEEENRKLRRKIRSMKPHKFGDFKIPKRTRIVAMGRGFDVGE